MTEWSGIKVGSIYKRTGEGSEGAPLALVVRIKSLGCSVCNGIDCHRSVELRMREGYDERVSRLDVGMWWPYEEVTELTEWQGIKVGSIYKRRGRGSRGAPLALVVGIEPVGAWYFEHNGEGVRLTTIQEGRRCVSILQLYDFDGVTEDDEPWPYKEVAV
jgi:hypothetical protein